MVAIINGKKYNTETAELILTLYGGARQGFRRDYYKTKKGTYFVRYVTVGEIDLVSEETIKDLLAIYDPDKYIELFGDVEEG